MWHDVMGKDHALGTAGSVRVAKELIVQQTIKARHENWGTLTRTE